MKKRAAVKGQKQEESLVAMSVGMQQLMLPLLLAMDATKKGLLSRAGAPSAQRHGQGTNGKLFGNLHRLFKELQAACLKEKMTAISPHDLRRSAGQWMVNIGVPVELVSKFMRHADTHITETIYASVRQKDVGDRILAAIDPGYATQAHQGREKPRVETLKDIPEPRKTVALLDVDGVGRTLTEWSEMSGIPKTTLHHRVVTRGMTMTDAIRVGRANYSKRAPSSTRGSVPMVAGGSFEFSDRL